MSKPAVDLERKIRHLRWKAALTLLTALAALVAAYVWGVGALHRAGNEAFREAMWKCQLTSDGTQTRCERIALEQWQEEMPQ